MHSAPSFAGLAAVLLACGAASPAQAGSSLLIWPIDPKIEAGRAAQPLWLENKGDEAVSVQIRVMRWTQDGGDDRHEPQAEVVASPPIATIGPGVRQLVRLISASGQRQSGEAAYRIFIDELPPSAGGRDSTGVRIQKRYALPLFVYGGNAAPPAPSALPELVCTAHPTPAGSRIELSNRSPFHARITAMTVEQEGRTIITKPGLAGYALAGQSLGADLPVNRTGSLRVRMNVNGSKAPVTVGCT